MLNRLYHDLVSQVGRKEVKVVQYPYRTAYLNHELVALPWDEELEKFLAEKAGAKFRSNHTVYQIFLPDGETFALRFSDGKVIFGLGVTQKDW